MMHKQRTADLYQLLFARRLLLRDDSTHNACTQHTVAHQPVGAWPQGAPPGHWVDDPPAYAGAPHCENGAGRGRRLTVSEEIAP